ncbi:1,5-anhydro-D-fructose reductase [Rubripirellula reticaptiva]|uniref:1,5-anhydro-D-fructose reductase n=2 Tax=Rubripirellula reticaptiva TaxID=2528013 RepID=A0A5C6EMD5_9BACT|nr:1,5-anhydro-D-fructose reductase [Rubripirellula reticaptiva]
MPVARGHGGPSVALQSSAATVNRPPLFTLKNCNQPLTMNALKVAVVGTGFIGPVHVEALRRAGQIVTGIVGSSPEKSAASAARLGLPKGYASLADVLADDEVQSVHIATPNELHFEQAAAVLRSGRHVLCEKPLAMTSSQTAELLQIAAKSGCVAGVAYNIRFYPLCHEAASRVAAGSIGEVMHVHGSYVQDWLLRPTDYNWRVESKAGGELRAVADIGTHWLDLVQFVTGRKVVSVMADLRTVHPNRLRPIGGAETFSGAAKSAANPPTESVRVDTEDCGTVMLQLDSGANGCLWVSQTTAGRKNMCQFEIGGTEQSLAWNSQSPNDLWIGNRDRASETLIRDPALMSDSAAGISQYPGGHNEGFPDTFKQMFRTFYGYIAAGDFAATAPFPTFTDGDREVRLCEAVLASHRERRWVDV